MKKNNGSSRFLKKNKILLIGIFIFVTFLLFKPAYAYQIQVTNYSPWICNTVCKAQHATCVDVYDVAGSWLGMPALCSYASQGFTYCGCNCNSGYTPSPYGGTCIESCTCTYGDCCDGCHYQPSTYQPAGTCRECTGTSATSILQANNEDRWNQCATGSAGSATSCQSPNCSGSSAACGYLTAGTSCRASAGVCDIAETCTGSAFTCPTDVFRANTYVCGYSAYNGCNPNSICQKKRDVYKCTGSSAVCPTTDQGDSFTPVGNGLVCSAGSEVAPSSSLYCTYVNACNDGACSGTKYWRGCDGTGDPMMCASSTGQTSSAIYASSGYSLTSSCGTTGTSYCSGTDNCSGNTRYTGYKCNGSGSCNVSSGDIGCCDDSKCSAGWFCEDYVSGSTSSPNYIACPSTEYPDLTEPHCIQQGSKYTCEPSYDIFRGNIVFGGLTNGYNSKTVGMGAPLGDNYPNDWWCHSHSGQGDFGVKTFYNQGDTDLCVGYVYDPCWNGGNVLYQNASGVRGDLGDADRTENNYSGCSWHNMWISLSSYLGGSNGYMSISFEGNGDYCSRDIYFGYKKSEIGSVTDGINSTWCCDQSTDCVDDAPAMGGGNSDIAGIGSGCYNTNTTHDADGDGDLDVCSSGSWIDCTSDSHCKNHFKCAAPTCYSSCSSNSQCVSGYYCSGSACIPILPNGLACNENSDCASGNCRKEIDSSNYFCAAAGKACSEGVSGHEGYSAGSLGSYGNPSWLCSATDTSYQCNATNKCKTYNSRYCDGAGSWNLGTGASVPVTGCNAYSCGASVLVVRDACNGSGACATGSVLVTTCGGGENSRCVAGQSTCQNLCSNSADDDGDGYTDGRDSDCGGCSQCTSGVCCNTSTGCYSSSGTVCRTAADLCDEVENCTGSSASCPSDALKPTGTVCRAAAGPCDVAETCIAGAPYCPQDVKLTGKQSCSTCQYCNGSSAACQYMAVGSDTYGDCGTCKICSGGACINVAIGEDPKNDCPFDDCKTGLCSGSGYCAYYTSGEQECPECQACSSSGVCVNAETLACPQDRMYCSDTNNRLCGAKEPGEVCCVLKSWGCFTADTMIKTTWGGDKKINKIRVGDLVQGYDTEKKQIKEVEVNNVFKHEKQNYYSIEFKDKSALRVTKDHPLYTENGYLKVENLKVGDKIGRINGDKLEFVEITKIKKSLFKKSVYNLEVDEYHNYFANGFLAHNKENACDKAPDNAGIKKNYPCGTCKLCYDGSCVNIAAGKDLNNECLAEGCLTGLCSGSGYCAYYTSSQQACYYGMVCDSSGKCVVDPNTNTLGAVQGETRLIVNNKNISFKEAAILTSKIGTCLNYPRQTCQSNEDCQITDFECLPMLRCSNNLTVTCDDDSDCISGESVCEGANVPAIYGSQNESVIIEADITLKPDAYLIFGDQLLFNGGKIILDGGAILRAGSMIQSGGGQGRRACACVYSSLENENYSFRSSGILTLSSGQGLCDDSIVCEEGTELLDNSSIDEQWVFKSETKKVDWDGIPFDWVEGVRYKKFSKYDKYSNNDCPSDCDKFYWRPKEDPESGEIIWYYYMCCSGIGPYGLSGCGGGEAVDRCWYDPYLPQLAPTTMPFYGWQ
jgi:hypothetical protein